MSCRQQKVLNKSLLGSLQNCDVCDCSLQPLILITRPFPLPVFKELAYKNSVALGVFSGPDYRDVVKTPKSLSPEPQSIMSKCCASMLFGHIWGSRKICLV